MPGTFLLLHTRTELQGLGISFTNTQNGHLSKVESLKMKSDLFGQ